MVANGILEVLDVEAAYIATTSITHRKKYAQFFTPAVVADLMAKWLLGNPKMKTVLEPAFGLGMFSRALFAQNHDLEINGFDIDASVMSHAQRLFGHDSRVKLVLQDYMYHDWENKYDGIICNPPYFKFHDYDNKGVLREIASRLSLRLNGFTNLYPLFLLKSIHQLADGGRAAYLIPSEFLNSDYGKLVKHHLIESGVLRHIVIVDFQSNVFDDALTTASILLLAKDDFGGKVQFSYIDSIQDFCIIENLITSYPKMETKDCISQDELDSEIKWRSYYQPQNADQYDCLVPFSNYGKVVRGIATGANDYFILAAKRATELGIQAQNLLPCICRAQDVDSSFFTDENFQILRDKDRSVYLFNAGPSLSACVKAYLSVGESSGIHQRFLTASRNPWYAIENRPPAPIWVSVFNRTGLRFIRNEAMVSNLTTFHCIYPKQGILFGEVEIDLLFAYLLTNVAREIFEDNRREYGNGLQKFEPNDINKAKMLDINLLDASERKAVLILFRQYRASELAGTPVKVLVEEIDRIFRGRFQVR